MIDLTDYTSDPGSMFVIFLAWLAVFHLTLVWPRNLSTRGWKFVDYIWVSVALLGLFAAVATTRKTTAEGLIYLAEGRVEAEKGFLRSALNAGAVCRTFSRTEFSPPEPEYNRLQKGFEEQCHWFKQANEKLAESLALKEVIRPEVLNVPPPRFGDDFPVTQFEQTLSRYNEAVVEFDSLNAATGSTDLERLLILFGPLFFAIAIALRLAKISGELRHEK